MTGGSPSVWPSTTCGRCWPRTPSPPPWRPGGPESRRHPRPRTAARPGRGSRDDGGDGAVPTPTSAPPACAAIPSPVPCPLRRTARGHGGGCHFRRRSVIGARVAGGRRARYARPPTTDPWPDREETLMPGPREPSTSATRAAELLALGAATVGESGGRPMRPRIRAVWRGARLAAPAYPGALFPGRQPGHPRGRGRRAAGGACWWSTWATRTSSGTGARCSPPRPRPAAWPAS